MPVLSPALNRVPHTSSKEYNIYISRLKQVKIFYKLVLIVEFPNIPLSIRTTLMRFLAHADLPSNTPYVLSMPLLSPKLTNTHIKSSISFFS